MKCKAKISEWFGYVLSTLFEDWAKEFKEYTQKPENISNNNISILTKAFDQVFYSPSFINTKYTYRESDWKRVIDVNKYIEDNNFYWTIMYHSDKYYALKYGRTTFIIDEKYIYDVVVDPEFNAMTLQEVSNHLLNGETFDVGNSMATFNNLSINDLNDKSKTYDNQLSDLKQQYEDIKNCVSPELSKIKSEIEKLQNTLKEQQEKLELELNAKKAELEDKMKALQDKIYMLKVQIYSIRCFTGDVIELVQLRTGESKSIETPIVLNQKIMYLDEDLAKLMSIYQNQVDKNHQLFEECLKYNDEVMETFCPQPKCITFFKCSKNGKSYAYNHEFKTLGMYDLLHGSQIGFIVRNGENLYIGWLPEEWDEDDEAKISFNDSVIYKPQIRQVDENEKVENSSKNEVISRVFALTVIQGLIEHELILPIPEKVNIQMPNKYIIHNYADGWIDDNRYGDFSVLVKNLNYYQHVGNKLLIIMSLGDSSEASYSATRSIGDLNTTRNCYVKSGLYDINVIKNGRTFISAKKEGWIEYKNNANFEVDPDEYINLTFMNTIWLKYFIDTKKIGNFGKYVNKYGYQSGKLDYAYLIKYFKEAYEYLVARERVFENSLRNLEDDEFKLDNYPEWKEMLSHWRIKTKAHDMTHTRYNRFKKYLLSGDYFKMSNLFGNADNEEKPEYMQNKPNLSDYYVTNVDDVPGRHVWYDESKKDINPYYYLSSEEDVKFDKDTLETDINVRYARDYEKIKYIYSIIYQYAKNYNVENYVDHKMFKAHIENTLNKLNEQGRWYWYKGVAGKILNDCLFEFNEDIVDKMREIISNSQESVKQRVPEKLRGLASLVIIQMEIIPEILSGIIDAIEYDYKYQTEKI